MGRSVVRSGTNPSKQLVVVLVGSCLGFVGVVCYLAWATGAEAAIAIRVPACAWGMLNNYGDIMLNSALAVENASSGQLKDGKLSMVSPELGIRKKTN